MLGCGDGTCADHDLGLSVKNGPNQLRDVFGAILIVRVGVNDDVRAGHQSRLDAGKKCARQAKIFRKSHQMLDSVLSRHVGGSVGATVIND